MGPSPLLACAVFAALALAGCADQGGAPAGSEGSSDEGQSPPTPPPAAPAAPGNKWLADAPHPAWTGVSSGSEPFMLADRNGDYLWIGDTSGGYWSDDNGTSWHKMPIPLGHTAGFGFIDGWVFAQDESGRLYAAVLDENRIDVVRSSNAGKAWTQTTYAAGVSGTADRPWIAAQGDNVALFYFDAPLVITGLFEHCALSTDAGLTFGGRNPIAGSPQGGNTIFDDDGNFYYGDNGGTVRKFAGSCLNPTSRSFHQGVGAYNNMIPVDVQGDVLCMPAATSGNDAIRVACSRDFGAPTAKTISPPFLQSNMFATISMHGDEIAVAWYGSETAGDPRTEGFDGAFNVYVAVITGFFEDEPTIRHYRLTEEPNHVGDICIGGLGCSTTADRDLLDYFGIDHDKWGGIHVAYAHDGAGASTQVRYAMLDRQAIDDNGTEVFDPNAPIADFNHHVRGYDIEVDASDSVDPQGQSLSYAWDWGDGGSDEGVQATHTYGDFGVYEVKLRVTAEDGRSSTTKANVLVDGSTSNAGPIAKFTFSPSRPEAGSPVEFKDRSTDDGRITERLWRFGDGLASNTKDPVHTYDAPGNYTVALVVTDEKGASDGFAGVLRVYPEGQGNAGEGGGEKGIRKWIPGPSVVGLIGVVGLAALWRRKSGR